MIRPSVGGEDSAVARTLQRGLAPDEVPTLDGLEIAGHYRAGGIGDVGGDWYDVLDLTPDGVAIVMGDVAGQGIAAATTMGQLRYATRAYLLDDREPSAVLGRLNRLVHWLLPGVVATVVIGIVSPDRTRVAVASAGHPPVLLLGRDGARFPDVAQGPALGLQAEVAYAQTLVDLSPGEGLLLYTDGLVERRGESIDTGFARLAQTATRHRGDPQLLDRVMESVPGVSAGDDLAVLAVCRQV